MDIRKFHDSLLHFTSVNTIEEVRSLCESLVARLGFDSFVYALRIPSQLSESRLIVITTYPEDWLEHYFAKEYSLNDPVMDYCKQHVVPVQWHDIHMKSASVGLTIMHEAAEFGLKNGLTVPVHAPHGEMAIFSMVLDRELRFSREVTQHAMPFIQLFASYLHEAVRRVSELATADEGKRNLTWREQECLRWVADGKTSWEISKVLNLSERTVNFHLKNAAVKLDVFNRQHAVVKAVMKGLLHPRPF